MLSAKSITSSRNPTVQSTRHLHRMSESERRREFLVEGTHQVQEAMATGWPLRSIFWTESWFQKNREWIARLGPDTDCYCVPEAILQQLATTPSPDGVVAVAARKAVDEAICFGLGLALISIRDPGNMGTLIRAAVAVGADGIFATPDSVSPFHPKVIRASAGQWFRHPPHVVECGRLIEHCRSAGIVTLAAASTGECYWDVPFDRPTLLVLGNEGAGLSQELLRSIDVTVAIPMQAGVESLNVAMAGTLLLYEAYRQRRAANPFDRCNPKNR